MTPDEPIKNDQILKAENQTAEESSQRKTKKNQTDNVKWSIFTEIETKIIAGKAAKKAGLKLNEWLDRAIRQQGTEELTKKSEPPARTEDLVKDIVAQFADKFAASQEAATKAQSALIEKQGQQIAELTKAVSEQPRGIKELLFGKKS